MTTVLGLDGCRTGWCGVMIDARDGAAHSCASTVFPSFADALATDARVIAIDIPIGLLDRPGGRGCDVEARRLLDGPRKSSVFSAPTRGVLYHHYLQRFFAGGGLTSQELTGLHRRAGDINASLTGDRLTLQAFHISKKIREVDEQMKPPLQESVYEVHPEVCFRALNGGALANRKKRLAGRLERWALLRRVLPGLPEQPPAPREMPEGCGVDDYIDAMVAAWTALCISRGQAKRVPEHPATDERGLCMEIWFPRS